MRRPRRGFEADQKAAIVRRHLAGKEPVSSLAEELQIQPSQIYGWINVVLEQAEKAFDRNRSGRRRNAEDAKKDQVIEQLQAKLTSKNEVIAELLEEHVQLKKANGEP